MRIKQAKEKIKDIVSKTNTVPALLGERGIGKTEVLKQVAAELGWGYQAIYPSSLEGPDFMGLVVKDLDAGVTRYLAPEFLPVEKSVERGIFPEQGLLVIEELNRAEVQTIHTLYPLLLERRINTHKIHDGWKIAVAINPDSMEYTTVSIDLAALDRLLIIPVEASVEDYSDYCISTGFYHRDVLAYLNQYPNMLVGDSEKAGSSFDKIPSPRGWSKVQELMLNGVVTDTTSTDMEILAGLVGSAAAGSLFGFLKNRDVLPIPAEEIIKDAKKAALKMQDIIGKKRYDVVNLTLRELAHVVPTNKKKASAIEPFLVSLPEELQVMFVRVLRSQRKKEFTKLVACWPQFKKTCYARIIEVISGESEERGVV